MNMNKAKTILFASLVAMMMLPFGAMEFVEAKTNNDNAKTKDDFKQDVKNWVRTQGGETRAEKISSLKAEYNEVLLELVAQALKNANVESISYKEVQAMVHYAVTETIKDEHIKYKFKENAVTDVAFDILSIFGLQEVHATCPSTTNPSYKQENIDIVGGSYGDDYFNGGNDLYLVLYTDDTGTCERTYSLYFYDEDHPNPLLDEGYDALRQVMFKRTHDIESFTIKNNNQIIFDDTYSGGNDFNCLNLIGAGCHLTHTKTYYPGSTVYVSNTWNHMMNTYDTNPGLTSVSVP